MSDRGGAAKARGEILLAHSNLLFSYWHRLGEGRWTRATFRWKMSQLRRSFRRELAHGAHSRCPKTAATCLELIAREPALWTFVRMEGIAPTNNAAEVRSVDQKPSVANSEDWSIGERRKLLAT